MRLRGVVLAAARAAEAAWDRIRPRRSPERPVLDPYRGYAVPGGVCLRGRVLASLRRTSPDPEHGKLQNLRQMISLFLTHEVAGIRVVLPATGESALSDEEGYVTLRSSLVEVPAGWSSVAMEIEGDPTSSRDFPVLAPLPEARFGVISDIDDTMMRTGAYSLARNLWTTFTGSALTREVFPDAVALMDRLSDGGRNPVFYVSSSPWNLHSFLDRVFARAGLARGPIFLRDLGIEENKLITSGHGDHKGEAISLILAANPDLPFILIGDTGQRDAQIYLEARMRHGDRIAAVVLREPGPGPDAASVQAIGTLREAGLPVLEGPDFDGVAPALIAAGLPL